METGKKGCIHHPELSTMTSVFLEHEAHQFHQFFPIELKMA